MTSKEKVIEKEVVTKPRNKRQSFNQARNKLHIAQTIDGYHLRWINDDGEGRIEWALETGYTFVKPEEVGNEARDDNKVKIVSGLKKDGTPMAIYLMKLPMEYHLEDVALAQGEVDKIDNAIKGGKIDAHSGDGRYVPNSGITYNT